MPAETPFTPPPPSQNSSGSSGSALRSPQMRKEALRTVYVNAQALQTNVNTKTIENLEHMINEVDTINQEGTLEDKIKDQGEIILDSEIMTISSHVIKKCTSSLSKNISCYDPDEFAAKIKSYLCRIPDTVDEEPNWTLLGKYAVQSFNRTAIFETLSGTLRPIAKKEVVRRRVVREAQAPVKRPENVIASDQVEDNVEQTVVEIFNIIKKYQREYKKPLDFFALVLHPTNFGKTIENILSVSFLIRDGRVKFIKDEEGVPQLLRSSKDEYADTKSNKKKRNFQNVISLNTEQWRELVKAYNIERPMIDLHDDNGRQK